MTNPTQQLTEAEAVEIVEVPLSRLPRVAIINAADLHLVSGLSWHLRPGHGPNKWYAQSSKKDAAGIYRSVLMHRLIVDPPPGLMVDHINGDGLDNRRENLRVCSVKDNTRGHRFKANGTSSRFRGVYFPKGRSKWRAAIEVDGRNIHLGYFTDETAAAMAYDAGALHYFGEFAALNFPVAAAIRECAK